MTTKECHNLSIKGIQNLVISDPSNSKYSYLNLNQINRNSSNAFSESSKNAKIEERKVLSSDDFTKNDDLQKSSHTSWNKSTKDLSRTFANNAFEKEDTFKKRSATKSAKNSSTFSLQIAAYENSVEANLFDRETEGLRQNGLIKKRENAKEIFMNSVIQNPFEFPRQQDIGASELKIQQFKASEQLLNIHELQINNGQQGFPWLFLFEVFIFFKEFAYEIPNVIFAIYFTYFFSVPKESTQLWIFKLSIFSCNCCWFFLYLLITSVKKEFFYELNWCTILCVAFFIGTNLILVDEGRNQLQGQRDSDKGITYGLKIAILFLVIIAGNIGIEYYVSITGYQRKYKDFVNLLILFWTFLISFIYTAKALGQRAPIEMLSPNNGNGYNYDIYTWTQTDDEVELRVRMNVYRLDANDVICKFDSKRVLYCGLKSYYPVPVIYGTLMANIKPKFEKTILQDRKIVVITFKKADHALLCDRVFVHEKPIQFG